MDDALHPAVRDMVATAAVDALVVAAALAGGLAVNGSHDLVHGSLVVGAVWVVIGPLGARAYVRRIVVEAAEEPASPVVARGPSRAVLVNGALLLAVAAILVAFDVLNAGFTGALFGVVLWQLTLAASVRRWERRTGRRMLYRPVYRWKGTNGRALGRGWFDPANFVSAPRG